MIVAGFFAPFYPLDLNNLPLALSEKLCVWPHFLLDVPHGFAGHHEGEEGVIVQYSFANFNRRSLGMGMACSIFSRPWYRFCIPYAADLDNLGHPLLLLSWRLRFRHPFVFASRLCLSYFVYLGIHLRLGEPRFLPSRRAGTWMEDELISSFSSHPCSSHRRFFEIPNAHIQG